MTLPSRYSSNKERKHIHLRLTLDMWSLLMDDKELRGSGPERIRMILLERYRQISSGSSREDARTLLNYQDIIIEEDDDEPTGDSLE